MKNKITIIIQNKEHPNNKAHIYDDTCASFENIHANVIKWKSKNAGNSR